MPISPRTRTKTKTKIRTRKKKRIRIRTAKTRTALLVQKAMADKLSDKVQVIIAPPGSGGFIGSALLAGVSPKTPPAADAQEQE